MHRNRELLIHCAVYIELVADSMENLKILQTDVLTELVRSKLNVDRLNLRQKEGFLSVNPVSNNMFKDRFERVLPASSVANLYPFNFGKGQGDFKIAHMVTSNAIGIELFEFVDNDKLKQPFQFKNTGLFHFEKENDVFVTMGLLVY